MILSINARLHYLGVKHCIFVVIFVLQNNWQIRLFGFSSADETNKIIENRPSYNQQQIARQAAAWNVRSRAVLEHAPALGVAARARNKTRRRQIVVSSGFPCSPCEFLAVRRPKMRKWNEYWIYIAPFGLTNRRFFQC